MNYLSLFSGIGGLDLGLDRAGMTCVGQVELDPWCRKVLAKHWPEVPKHDDVRTAPQWWQGRGASADLVAGGFPCQPFSTAGRREGVTDERWGWPWFWDVVRVVRPRWVLVENVAALLADRDAWGIVLADLAAGGYDTDWDCIPAAAVGAPHLRDRVFLVAHARCLGRGKGQGQLGGLGTAERGKEVANPDRSPRRPAARDAFSGDRLGPVRSGPSEPRGRRGSVADSDGAGLERSRGLHDPPTFAGSVPAHGGWWSAEPDVGRVAHGVPSRVDRLRGLGNAVVPQVAEHIGRLILAADLERVS